ncbi:MAG: MalY/PatB family protein [Vagococcus sp.]|uniref:MalY/PatB family protein n=1 Tax=Vagococcus sp. TaxID=1933889 RepID=UPI002FCB4485
MSIENFIRENYVERKRTDSVKWDGLKDKFGHEDLLPLWVADMDFKAPKEVQEALMKRIEHGVFGYSFAGESYYEAFINWQKKRHGIHVEKEWLRFTTGVVNSFNFLIQALTKEEESVIILAPVYYPFFDAVKNNRRRLVVSNLVESKGHYTIDFEDFEEKIRQNKVKVFLHCSPQNPVGRIWKKEELEKLFNICQKYQVKIISDEIHQDFIQPGKEFVSALSVGNEYLEDIAVLTSSSKSFNLASLLHSHVIIPSEAVRIIYDKHVQTVINNPDSLMGMIATEAAYTSGEQWLDDLIDVIELNFKVMKEKITEELPHVVIAEKEATYLAWVDLSYYIEKSEMVSVIQDKAKLAIDYGEWFDENSSGFIRINLATKTENIEKAVDQLVASIKLK